VKVVSQEIIERLVKEIERSFVEGEYAQARRMLRRFLRQKATEDARTQLLLLFGRSHLYQGNWKKALESLQAAEKKAQRSRDFEAAASILNYIGDCHTLQGDTAAATRFYNRSLRICKERNISGQILARNISDLAQTAGHQGEHRKALARWEEAVGIYQTLPASREHAFALHNTAMLKSRLGHVDNAIADATKSLSVLVSLGRKVALADSLWLLGTLHAQKGEYRDGLHYMEEAVRETGGVADVELVRTYIAYTGVLIEIGAFARAKRRGEEALAASRRLRWNRGVAICQTLLARVRLSGGDPVAALHYLRDAKRLFGSGVYLVGEARALITEAEARIHTLNLKEAQKALKEASAIVKKTDDILLKSDCAAVESMMLVAQKKHDQSLVNRLRQFCGQLKPAWRHQYLKVKYHLGALLVLGGKLEDASKVLEELLEETRQLLESLPKEYRGSYRNHPLPKAITELVLKLHVEATLEHTSIDNVMDIVKVFQERSPAKPGTALAVPGDSIAALEIVYESEAMQEVVSAADRVARTNMPVLVTGETGVGKEILALYLHLQSGRRGQFVPINCAAVPSSLMESELFGYVKGAFTGATADRRGLFVSADEGTLFLDEVGSMPPEMQAKLLRVLEHNIVRPLGSTEHVAADVRLLCASNRDLKEDVARGRFREDLFYRINVVTLNIPPLRERRKDIPALIEYFLRSAGSGVRVRQEALDSLIKYDWPGNVREVKNEVARLLTVAEDMIEKSMLKDEIVHPKVSVPTGGLAEMEKRMIQEVLRKTGFNKQKAARLLGISRTTLYEKIKRYRLEHTES
jgi:transcriptional regulator with PAS, ATPase and Fis domain